MSTVAISFASLVKNNNGFFKSEKQAAFLLSQCQDGMTFITSGDVYGNAFSLNYNCDSQGVVTVEKYLNKKGEIQLIFQRVVQGEVNQVEDAKKAKEIKRLNREIKVLEKKIKERMQAFESGQYVGMESLFHDSQKSDLQSLEGYKAILQDKQ